MSADASRLVYDLTEGSREQVDLLGGKGANLAEMTRLGLPVPPGFTITTEACRHYLARGASREELRIQVTMALRRLEDALGRRLGDVERPAAGVGALGREVLHARDDGDRPQRRTQRRLGAGAAEAPGTSGSRGTPTDA